MTRRSIRWLVGLCLSGLLAGLGLARAQSTIDPAWPARVGRVAELQGTVWFFDRDEDSWIEAHRNRPLTSGDRLSTDRDSRVELRVGSVALRLAADSDLSIRQLDDRALVFELTAGSLALRALSRDVLSQIEVITAEGRFVPRATGHYRIDRRGDGSEATTWRGSLEFEGRDSRLVIDAGQHAEIWLQGAQQTSHYRWLDVERDEFADWVARDDRDVDRSDTARYVSPEMTGWEDLDRYGRWNSHPEFGSVWIPSDVPVGWAPYRDGRWTWVSPWGWTWIDTAPWGFAPFHYGRWVRWGSRWVWTPGPRGIRPVYAPALVTWTFGSYSGGRRPPPPIGWAPLGRHDVFRPHPHPVRPVPRDRVAPPPPPPRADRLRPAPPPPAPGGRAPYSTNQGLPSGVTVVPRDAFAQPPAAGQAAPPPPRLRPPAPQVPSPTPQAPPPPPVMRGGAAPAPTTAPPMPVPATPRPVATPPAVAVPPAAPPMPAGGGPRVRAPGGPPAAPPVPSPAARPAVPAAAPAAPIAVPAMRVPAPPPPPPAARAQQPDRPDARRGPNQEADSDGRGRAPERRP